MPFFSIITPSLQRESLVRLCRSVEANPEYLWEHIVALDSPTPDWGLIAKCAHPNRNFLFCGERHGHYGNHARVMACDAATGNYFVWADDDNYFAYENVLHDMAMALESAGNPPFALFPIMRHGSYFLYDPPGMCRTDSANIVVKRDIGRWPDIEAREADGVLVERLRDNYPYVSFPDFKPIIVMEHSSNGE
jgi:hypothetical protein